MVGYRFIATVGFILLVGGSAQGMNVAPAAPSDDDDIVAQVAVGCGPGRTRINGVCVARTTMRQTRRAARRCIRWQGGACVLYN